MVKVSINSGSEYLFARLHGIWSNQFQGESLEALTHAESESQLLHQLESHGVVSEKYDTFQRDMKVRELKLLNGIRGSLSGGLADFYYGFMRLTFYGNMKTIFHYRYFNDNSREISRLLIPSPLGDTPDMDKISHVESTEEFLRCLELRKYSDEISQCVCKLLDNHDVFQAESSMDILAYRELMEAALCLPSGVRSTGVSLVGEMVDVLNVSMLMRNLATYHFSPKRMSLLWLSGGASLDSEKLSKLCECGDVSGILSGLPYGLRKICGGLGSGGALSEIENGMWKGVYGHALREFRSMSDLSLSVVAFPFLLHFETMNLCRVREGVHFRMSPVELSRLLID